MAVFKFDMERDEAVKQVKKAILNGKLGIMQSNANSMTVGAPFMSVRIKFYDDTVMTSSVLFGFILIANVNTQIEFLEGFTRVQ